MGRARRIALLAGLLTVTACKTVEGPSGQGGASFREVAEAPPTMPLEALYGVCWQPNAGLLERVKLTPLGGGDFTFEVSGGANNSTGWCLRELITSYPVAQRPSAEFELGPPTEPTSLWAALAWVKLLSPSRFGPERGLLDPAPLAAKCLARGPVRSATFAVEHAPLLAVRGLAGLEPERCLEAVLAATAWPAPKELRLKLGPPPKAVTPAGEVAHYFAPEGEPVSVLDAQLVRDTMRTISPKVAACWNETLVRRAGVSGSRTFRLRTDASGVLTAAWVATGLADGAATTDAILDRCLARALQGLRFPGTSGDGAYTWVFATR